MLKSGDSLNLGPLRTKIHIKKTAAETDGRSFETEWEMGPQTGGTPLHTHPKALESFEVLQGKLDLRVNGSWRTLTAGETTSIEKGIPHTVRNASDEVTRVTMTFQPALKYDEYFDKLEKLVNSGVVESEDMTFKAMAHLSMLMTSHPDEIRSVSPPYAAMRVFALAGRLLGYRV
ncbi:MAG: cupin domain-containing protein [Rubricoccaceae bacterium]|nr:cupin domain-containing protein [Rubricoccaceae bacterium]